MFRSLAKKEKMKSMMSALLQMWTGILLIYTFEIHSLVSFLVSAILWRLAKFDGKQNINVKKLSVIVLLVFMSGHYGTSEFVFNTVVGFTVFQVLSFFSEVKEKSQHSWLPIVYVTMAIYYTLRMTLVFNVPDALIPAHDFFAATTEYLRANKTVEWTISISLVVLNALIFLKTRRQSHLPLIMSVFFGMCGLEDMSAIIGISVLGKLILKIKMGDEEESEHKKSVQQTGKIYKL